MNILWISSLFFVLVDPLKSITHNSLLYSAIQSTLPARPNILLYNGTSNARILFILSISYFINVKSSSSFEEFSFVICSLFR